jgi:hypothetical protein
MVLTTRLVSFRVSKWLRNAPLLAIAYCVWPHHVVTLLWSSSTEKIWNLRNVLLFIKRLSKWKVLLKLNCFWGNLDAQITWIISPWGCGEGIYPFLIKSRTPSLFFPCNCSKRSSHKIKHNS